MSGISIENLLTAHPVAAVGAVFVGGVLTSLTPCIYPMIPITAAIIGGQSATRTVSFRRTATLTFSYVLGLALAYAALGLLAGLTGQLFGAISTNPWLYFTLANLLAVFGLMMLEMRSCATDEFCLPPESCQQERYGAAPQKGARYDNEWRSGTGGPRSRS